MRRLLMIILALILSACQGAPTTHPPTAVPSLPTVLPSDGSLTLPTALATDLPTEPPTARSSTQSGWTRITTADSLPSNDLLTVATANIVPTGIEPPCIVADSPMGQSVWVGTNGAGLGYWDGARWNTITTTTPETGLASNTVQAIFILPRGRVMIGTSQGLSTFCPLKPPSWEFRVGWNTPRTSIQAIYLVGATHFFGGPEGTLAMYQTSLNRLFTTANGLGANDTRAIVGDGSRSRAWAGTFGGGVAIFEAANTATRLRSTLTTDNSGLPNNYVTSLAREASGVLWIGYAPDPAVGRAGGVSRYDESAPEASRWQHFGVASGALPSDDVRTLAVDRDGDLWVGTANGLARRAAATGAWTRYTVETTGGGLGNNSISAIAVALDGTRWFATRGGGLTRLVGSPPVPVTETPGPSRTTEPTRTATATAGASQPPPQTATPAASATRTSTPTPSRTVAIPLTPTFTPTPARHPLYLPHLSRDTAP